MRIPAEDAAAIRAALTQVKTFAKSVHSGAIQSPAGKRFTQVLLIGIGGSALGPQLATDALATASKPR